MAMAERIPRPGEFYRHFKNKMYQIIAVAEHSETGEAMVVYQALYGDFRTYVRPLEMFVSEVDHDKYPKVTQKYRFEQVASPEAKALAAERRREKEAAGKQSLLDTWQEGQDAAAEPVRTGPPEATAAEKTRGISAADFVAGGSLSDFEDYEEADLLTAQESVVIPRNGRAEETEDDLWESLTDEVVRAAEGQEEEAGEKVNPRFLDFLEARTYESKAVILESMREELDDELIDGLAMAVDVEIPAGPIAGRYHQLLQCLETMARYEDTRLR